MMDHYKTLYHCQSESYRQGYKSDATSQNQLVLKGCIQALVYNPNSIL